MAKKRESDTSRTAAARAIPSPQQTAVEGSDDGSISKPSTDEPHDSARILGLAIVATPIGNAGDITLRALDLLRRADRIACEDTRVTGRLLARYGIATPLLAYHEHNAARMRPLLLERLRRGETIALVSDAGTPLISDPGYKLVRAAVEAGIPVTTLPGASAALAALVSSGLPTDRFFFAGFLPPRMAARRTELAGLAGIAATLIFFESAGRLAATLADMAAVLGARDAAVARELTKLYEEVRRGKLAELAEHYAAAGPPKGEIVIVVGPPATAAEASDEAIDDALRGALATSSLRDAVAAVTAALDAPRRRVYARALALAGSQP
ncbi:MAG TPA: 16S rRNA (cytidine(1402)-2'-O)-methyltransferase [Candidatus Angelobacter sp.]|nr:16S rRNA (cytidine(1402)-2'-O)-methyltransferase [Candidatus Angelobacter sp.]